MKELGLTKLSPSENIMLINVQKHLDYLRVTQRGIHNSHLEPSLLNGAFSLQCLTMS